MCMHRRSRARIPGDIGAIRNNRGFTLAEVVLVMIIVAIVAGVAMRGAVNVTNSARVERTKQIMQALEFAIVGNPELKANGMRSDYGYVGDIGALPPNLQALISDPGLGTWRGPYVHPGEGGTYQQYLRDAWNQSLTLNGAEIVSTGSGQTIVRRLASSTSALTSNRVHGVVVDSLGRGPDSTYRDSLAITLSHPDGSGAVAIRPVVAGRDGYFEVTQVPVGHHKLTVALIPNNDSITRYIDVSPESSAYIELRLPTSF